MDPLMQLVVGWTLVGGFVFTVVVTLLSLVGVVKFADPRQQRALFGALVLELIVGVGGQAVGAWRFDARAVGADVYAEGALDGGAAVGEAWIASQASPQALELSRAAVLDAVGELRLPASSKADARRRELVEGLRAAPDRDTAARALREARDVRFVRPP